jgi:hypothetical protein
MFSPTIYRNIIDLMEKKANRIIAVKNETIDINKSIKTKLDQAMTDGNLIATLKTIVLEPTFYTISESENSMRLHAFDSLNSQLERLQNPGSAIWRVVTAPENSEKWNKKFNRTYFYAEGKSGVVIVRDSPIDFRIQEAANNPAALVQAQLGVSRAIADAAIQIAGAATGNPLVNASLGSNNKITKSDNNSYQADNESLVMKKAALARKAELRTLAINAMTANLRSKRDQLERTKNKNKKGIQDLVDELINSLEARQSYFINPQGGSK